MTAKMSNIAQGGVRVEFRIFEQLTLSIYAEFYADSKSGNGFCQGVIQEWFISKILFCKPSGGPMGPIWAPYGPSGPHMGFDEGTLSVEAEEG